MKVRCTKLIDVDGKSQTSSPWLTVGKMYHVLSIVLDTHGNWLFRLSGNSVSGLGLFPKEQFEIIDAKIPNSWVPTWNDNGFFELAPEAWTKAGFWERYFEHDHESVRQFNMEAEKIVAVDT